MELPLFGRVPRARLANGTGEFKFVQGSLPLELGSKISGFPAADDIKGSSSSFAAGMPAPIVVGFSPEGGCNGRSCEGATLLGGAAWRAVGR